MGMKEVLSENEDHPSWWHLGDQDPDDDEIEDNT